MFGFAYGEVAEAVGRSEQACRQLNTRARAHMAAGRPRFAVDRRERAELAERFFAAIRAGDLDGLRALLADDVAMVGDSGGKGPRWGTGIFGARNVARLVTALAGPFARIGGVVERHDVNGQPGAVFRDRDGRIVNTWALDVRDGRVQTIHTVTNPDKLAHLGPVADAWAVVRSTIRARSAGLTREQGVTR